MLTPTQQSLVTNSMWIVNTALKRQGLSADKDLKQDALMYLCVCAERFDSSKGVQWDTYAYKSVYLYIKRKNLDNKKKIPPCLEDESLIEDIEAEDSWQEDVLNGQKVKQIKAMCNSQELKVMCLKEQGYGRLEICREIGQSSSTLSVIMKGIREKAKEIIDD